MPKKRALKTSKHIKAAAVIFGVINWSVQKRNECGKIVAADRRKKAKTKVAKGPGDRGDTWALSLLAPRTVRAGAGGR